MKISKKDLNECVAECAKRGCTINEIEVKRKRSLDLDARTLCLKASASFWDGVASEIATTGTLNGEKATQAQAEMIKGKMDFFRKEIEAAELKNIMRR